MLHLLSVLHDGKPGVSLGGGRKGESYYEYEGGTTMSADVFIHVFEGIDENELAIFSTPMKKLSRELWWEIYNKIQETPKVWVGEATWWDDRNVPPTITAVMEAIGERLPVLDDFLFERIMAAFRNENETGYELAIPNVVKEFLKAHKGKRLFTFIN